jgi:hypothetical protein
MYMNMNIDKDIDMDMTMTMALDEHEHELHVNVDMDMETDPMDIQKWTYIGTDTAGTRTLTRMGTLRRTWTGTCTLHMDTVDTGH